MTSPASWELSSCSPSRMSSVPNPMTPIWLPSLHRALPNSHDTDGSRRRRRPPERADQEARAGRSVARLSVRSRPTVMSTCPMARELFAREVGHHVESSVRSVSTGSAHRGVMSGKGAWPVVESIQLGSRMVATVERPNAWATIRRVGRRAGCLKRRAWSKRRNKGDRKWSSHPQPVRGTARGNNAQLWFRPDVSRSHSRTRHYR